MGGSNQEISPKRLTAQRIARIPIAVVGGYFAVSWTAAWSTLALIQGLGMQRGDAVILTSLLSMLGYAGLAVWIFAHRSTPRVLFLLVAWSLASLVLAQALARTDPSQFSAGVL